jgi:hypothetical protein
MTKKLTKKQEKSLAAVGDMIADTDRVFDAMCDMLEKLDAEERLDPSATAFVLARAIGHLMACDPSLPIEGFKEVADGIGILAALQARHLREENGGQPLGTLRPH